MTWAIRSEPVFLGESSNRRSELVLEILRALFAMDVGESSDSRSELVLEILCALFAMDAGVSSITQYSQETMTQLGIILCELLKLSSSDARVHQCKLAVVALLLNAPNEYAEYLATNGGIMPLVSCLWLSLNRLAVEPKMPLQSYPFCWYFKNSHKPAPQY
jgi:hypothetical protein